MCEMRKKESLSSTAHNTFITPKNAININNGKAKSVKALFVVNIFYPHMGGTARIYYEMCNRFSSGEICVLTQRMLPWENTEINGCKDFDKKQKFRIYRLRRIRPKIIKRKTVPNSFISAFMFIFQDLIIMIYTLFAFFYVILKERIDIIFLDNPDSLGWLAAINSYTFA
jgi:hypothetical protein